MLFKRFLDTFFHLPTLLAVALVCLIVLWQLCDFGFDFGQGFVRLNSNQGNVTLYWVNGCCDLDW